MAETSISYRKNSVWKQIGRRHWCNFGCTTVRPVGECLFWGNAELRELEECWIIKPGIPRVKLGRWTNDVRIPTLLVSYCWNKGRRRPVYSLVQLDTISTWCRLTKRMKVETPLIRLLTTSQSKTTKLIVLRRIEYSTWFRRPRSAALSLCSSMPAQLV